MTLNDPDLVRREYATEVGLLARRSIYEDTRYESGDGPLEVMFSAVAEALPLHVLEVGCGPGEAAERIAGELSADVVALDISPRMVELSRARGVSAQVGDVQNLPFADESFDCVLAAWMLFHVPDVDRGLAEISRVLVPGGRLVAVTNSELHLSEARELAGVDMRGRVSFSRENGEPILARHFDAVERRDVDGWVTFSDADAVRRLIGSMVTMFPHASSVPDFEGTLRAGTRVTVFVAEKAL
jgi:SAM-dependent methyltransferase